MGEHCHTCGVPICSCIREQLSTTEAALADLTDSRLRWCLTHKTTIERGAKVCDGSDDKKPCDVTPLLYRKDG